MSGSFGILNAKYNTLYALYLSLLNTPSGVNTLQEVLDAGNTADKTIQLTSDGGIQSNHSSTSINFVDATNNAITNLDNNALTSFNATTGQTYALNSEQLVMGGVAGANYTTMSNGNLTMTAVDGKYVALSTTSLNFNGSSGSEGQVLSKDITNVPVWSDPAFVPTANQDLNMNDNSLLNVNQISDSNGDKGLANQVLISGGPDAPFIWGSGGGALVGTLGEVLQNGHVASTAIDMNNFDILNIKSLDISTPLIPISELTNTRLAFPITINGVLYYLPLFTAS